MASDSETVVQNTGFLLIGEVTTRALSLLLVFAIAKSLGGVGLGAYAFAFAFTDLLINFIDLGIPTYINREIAKNRSLASSYLSNVLGLRAAMAPAAFVLGALIAIVASITHTITPETLTITLLATAGMALNFLTEPFRSVFMAHEKGSYYSGLIIFERLLFTLTGLGLLLTGYSLKHVMAAYILSQLVAFLTNAYFVRKKFASFTPSFDTKVIAHIIKGSASFWIASFLRMVYQRIDTIMLSTIHGFTAAGLYGAAYKITEALRFIPTVIVIAIFPTISRLHAQSKEHVKALYEKTFHYLLIAALPMATGLTLISDRVILLFYTPEFRASITALQLLIWAEALIFLHYLMGFVLGAAGKQHLFTITTGAYTIANVALNLLLIPKYSYIGAAASAVLTQALAVVMLYHYCSKNGYGLNLPKMVYKPLIAAAAMAAAILAMKQLHLFIIVPAAAAAYFGVLALLRDIGKDELNLAKTMIGKVTGKK